MTAASPASQRAPFNQLLPAEVSAASAWFGRARSYPIFCPSWYRYRSRALLAGCLIACLVAAALIGTSFISKPAMSIDWRNTFQVTAVYLLPLLSLCTAGPGLAVLARRRALARFETAVLLAALLLGMVLSGKLFTTLTALYEKPSHDPGKRITVAHSLPGIKIDVKLNDYGATRTYRKDPAALALAKEYTTAVENLKAANAAADAHTFTMKSHFDKADEQAMKDMETLDTGGSAITPARRAQIEQAYKRAMEKQQQFVSEAAQIHSMGVAPPPATMQQKEAAKRVAELTTRRGGPWPLEREQDLVSRKIGAAAVVIVAIGALLLLSWLGGLFDLVAFVRQRGRLADVLAEKELERTRAARNEAELRLSVLAAQVEPHFLFNTLASVRSAIDSDPQRAGHIVDHMVAFLRASIPQMRMDAATTTVALGGQLHAARSYLALMHERMPRLQFTVDTDSALDAAQVPPLMLISLVENAVKHGVEPKIGPAHVTVRARRIDAEGEPLLEVAVSDDGVGFGEAASGGGIGLANIQERLRSYFGQRASLTLKALPGGGIAAILRLPLGF